MPSQHWALVPVVRSIPCGRRRLSALLLPRYGIHSSRGRAASCIRGLRLARAPGIGQQAPAAPVRLKTVFFRASLPTSEPEVALFFFGVPAAVLLIPSHDKALVVLSWVVFIFTVLSGTYSLLVAAPLRTALTHRALRALAESQWRIIFRIQVKQIATSLRANRFFVCFSQKKPVHHDCSTVATPLRCGPSRWYFLSRRRRTFSGGAHCGRVGGAGLLDIGVALVACRDDRGIRSALLWWAGSGGCSL